jgi:hypothetical protein
MLGRFITLDFNESLKQEKLATNNNILTKKEPGI